MLKKLHGLHLHGAYTFVCVCVLHMNIENVCVYVCVCVCICPLYSNSCLCFVSSNFHYETHLIWKSFAAQ